MFTGVGCGVVIDTNNGEMVPALTVISDDNMTFALSVPGAELLYENLGRCLEYCAHDRREQDAKRAEAAVADDAAVLYQQITDFLTGKKE